MRTIAKTLAILLTLFFCSSVLIGQKTFLSQDIEPDIVFVAYRTYDVKDQVHAEASMPLENWMIIVHPWNKAEIESEFSLEEWMVPQLVSGKDRITDLAKEDAESPMKLEIWMYCCADWKVMSM